MFVAVTNDKYEIPIAVADSMAELARKTGVSQKTIHRDIFGERGVKRRKAIPWKFLEIDTTEDYEEKTK